MSSTTTTLCSAQVKMEQDEVFVQVFSAGKLWTNWFIYLHVETSSKNGILKRRRETESKTHLSWIKLKVWWMSACMVVDLEIAFLKWLAKIFLSHLLKSLSLSPSLLESLSLSLSLLKSLSHPSLCLFSNLSPSHSLR